MLLTPVHRVATWFPPLSLVVIVTLTLLLIHSSPLSGQNSPAETNQISVLLTTEGTVEARAADGREWARAVVGQKLEAGAQLRTGERSRATVRLSNLSVMRVSALMTMEILPPPASGGQATFDLKAGKAYFFSRDKPRNFLLRTPTATGAIRGTEFNVEVGPDGRTVLTLIDGEVELSGEEGTLTLTSGEQGIVERGKAPTRTAVLQAVNIIQWCLYYPGVLNLDDLSFTEDEERALRESLDAYRAGDLLGALEKYPAGRQPASEAERIYQAGLLLAVGQVERSEELLENLSASPARALRKLVAAVKFQEWERSTGPDSASEWLAESYCLQSRGKLDAARSAARSATERSPNWGLARVREAELEFSFGRTEAAQAALEKGLQLSPRHAEGWVLKGFLLSARGRIAEAQRAFAHAIELDPALGNAWLGHGLIRIHRGQLELGRQDLEVAAVLEPQRSLFRSYLGKAFGEEGDWRRALKELALAAQLDPNDPTSWLYRALVEHQQNRVNEAVRDLEKSQDLNDNRSVFRSRLLLDQDQAVRSANLAAIYRDAGMIELSVREAARAVNSDYGNFAGHYFLASSYDELRDPRLVNLRYETPWYNELLLANLLAPVGAGNLSQNISQQEYSPLFEHDHFGVSSRVEYFSSGDWVQRGSQYGTFGRTSYSIDSDYRNENGQRPNSDLEQLTLTASVKQQLTPRDSILLRAVYFDYEAGDVSQYYDQRSASAGLRVKENQEPLLLVGYHHEWGPGVHTLALAGRFVDEFRVSDPAQSIFLQAKDDTGQVVAIAKPSLPSAPLKYRSDLEIYSAEVQQIIQLEKHGLILGARFQAGTFDTSDRLGASTPATIGNNSTTSGVAFVTAPIAQKFSSEFERVNGYGYYNWRIWEPLLLTAGMSYEYLRYPLNHRTPPISDQQETRDQWSPKAGLTWTPAQDTMVRFAYTRSLGGLTFDQSVRLEPSQVSGFNQAFRSLISESVAGSAAAATFETFGLGLDQKFQTGTYLGIEAEVLQSDVDRVLGAVDLTFPPASTASSTRQKLDYEEKNLLITLNQLVGDQVTLGVRYRLSDARLKTRFPDVPNTVATPRFENEATLHQANFSVLFNHHSGLFSMAEAVWRGQSNRDYEPDLPDDEFWQFNFYVGYRFARRRAEVRFGLLNITDQDYRLNPLNLYAELPRERTFTTSVRFNF